MSTPAQASKPMTAKREAVLSTAARLFARDGFAAVSMRMLADEIGITPAALYHHFPDKEALYYGVLQYVFTDKSKAIFELLENNEEPARRRIEQFIVWLIDLFASDEVTARLLHRELLDSDEKRIRFLTEEMVVQPFHKAEELMRELAPDHDPGLSAWSIAALIIGHYQLMPITRLLLGKTGAKEEREQFTEHVKTLLFEGLGGGYDSALRKDR